MNHLQKLSGPELILFTILVIGTLVVIAFALLSKKTKSQPSTSTTVTPLIPKDRLTKEQAMRIVWEKHAEIKSVDELVDHLEQLLEDAAGKPGVAKVDAYKPDDMRDQLMAQYGFDMLDVLKNHDGAKFFSPYHEVGIVLRSAVQKLIARHPDKWREEEIHLFRDGPVVCDAQEGDGNLSLPYYRRNKGAALSTLSLLRKEVWYARIHTLYEPDDPLSFVSYENLATRLNFSYQTVFERTLNLEPELLIFLVPSLMDVTSAIPLGSGKVIVHQTKPLKVERIDDEVLKALEAFGHEGVEYHIYRSAGMLNIEVHKDNEILLICDARAYFNYLHTFEDVKDNTLAAALLARGLCGSNEYGFSMCRLQDKIVTCYFNTRNIIQQQGEPS